MLLQKRAIIHLHSTECQSPLFFVRLKFNVVPFCRSSTLSGTTPSPGPSSSSALALSLSPPPLTNSPGSVTSSTNPTVALLLWLFAPVALAPLPPYVGGASFQAQRNVIFATGKAAAEALRSPARTPEADWGDIGRRFQDEVFLAE